MKTHLLTLSPAEFCRVTHACREGAEYAVTQPTLNAVWENCPKVSLLIWILNAIEAPQDEKELRLYAIWCARNTPLADGRKTGDLLTDPRSIAALEVAERYAHGNATPEELAAASDAARAAAWGASWAAASDAASDAAWAAACEAASDAARAAARASAVAAQTAEFKRVIANPFPEGVQS